MNEVLDFPTIDQVPALAAPVSIRATVLAQFHATEPGLVALAARYDKVAYDTSTPKGLIAAKAARLDLRDNGRFLIERAEKRIKVEVNDLKRDMADEVARLVAIVQPVEDQVDMQIKAREAVLAAEKADRDRIEAERMARHEAVIAGIYAYPGKARGATAERISAGIAYMEAQVYGPELEEYQARAATAHAEVIDTLRDMHAAALKAEQDAADREAQRAENARVAAELAAERTRLAAEAAAVKAQALDLQRKLDAQAKKEAAEMAAQRAESDRLERLAEEKRFPVAAMVARLAALAVPADAPQVATPEPVETQPVRPMFLELGDIAALMGFGLPPDFLTLTLRIKPAATDDGAPLFNPSQWGDICDALVAHITNMKDTQCQ